MTIQSVFRIVCLLLIPLAVCGMSYVGEVEDHFLSIVVFDMQDKPIKGVTVNVRGDGTSGITDDEGKTRIVLAPQTQPGSEVALYIVSAPKDLEFISPMNKMVRVPPFENASQNSVEIVLAERGSRRLLADSKALTAITASINSANVRNTVSGTPSEKQRVETLGTVAQTFGFSPKELDAAIREWGRKTKDFLC
jgi:hypothetical protein